MAEPPPTDSTPAPSLVPLLLWPGEDAGPFLLTDLLRDAHTEAAEGRAREIARRQKERIPLDDSTVWAEVEAARKHLASLPETPRDGRALRAAAERLLLLIAPPLEPLPAFEAPPRLEGIRVMLRTCTAEALSRARSKGIASQGMWRKAIDVNDADGLDAADAMARRSMDDLVSASVVWIEGLATKGGGKQERHRIVDVDGDPRARLLDALHRAGLMRPLNDACVHFQGLPAGKDALSG